MTYLDLFIIFIYATVLFLNNVYPITTPPPSFISDPFQTCGETGLLSNIDS